MPLLNKDSVGTEETLFYAQKIIDFFGKSIKDSGCLTQIPITIYEEADHHLDKIDDIIAVFEEQVKPNHGSKDIYRNDPLRAAIKRSIGSKCLDCRPTMPTIRFNGLKGQVHSDAKDFLLKIKNINGRGDFSKALPSIALVLSSLCIPDLIKLLSLLLASVIRISFSLDITKFSFLKLLTAIIQRLMAHLLQFTNISVNFSLTSIMCILDAFVQLNSSLTAEKSLDYGLSINNDGISFNEDDNKERIRKIEDRVVSNSELDNKSNTTIFMGTEIRSKSININNFSIVEKIRNGIKKYTPDEINLSEIKSLISSVENLINSSLADMETAIAEFMQIGQFIQCESQRSTTKASDSIESVIKYIQLINLIRSVIKKKTEIIAQNLVSSNNYNQTINSVQFSNQDIASVVGESLGQLGTYYNTDPDNIGILLKDNQDISDSPLSIYSCNINDFIERSKIDNIIEDARTFATNTVGRGNEPSYFSGDYIVTSSDNFIPFDIDNDDVIKQLTEIIDFLNIDNPYKDIYPIESKGNGINLESNITNSIDNSVDSILNNIGKINI